MDGAILVVAGTDGSMPQTKEHLLLANQVSGKKPYNYTFFTSTGICSVLSSPCVCVCVCV